MDLAGHFTYVSPSVEKLRGYSAAEVMQQTLDQVLTPDSARIVWTAMQQITEMVRQGEKLPEQRHELEQPCKDGSTVWTEVTTSGIYTPSGEFLGLLGVTRDITVRRRTEARMAHMAQHDALTDLPNRTLLEDRVERALVAAQRNGQPMALIFMDLDRFKAVNDQYGHAVGDRLLQTAAARLAGAVRASDTVARIGGDEFVVLLPVVASAQDALAVADKIREALAHPFDLGDVRGEVSASIGVAMYPGHGHTPVELLRHADEAMYTSKQAGSNRVTLYSAQNPGH
jgi:diguanylate cyclase (GGDEF)-like protein/PAS domain S-box-containing protein